MSHEEYLTENARRLAALDALDRAFDPVRGSADADRVEVDTPDPDMPRARVPQSMVDDPAYLTVRSDLNAWRRLRCRHDFAYWCAVCVKIKHKLTGRDVPLRLNRAQRKVAARLDAMRRSAAGIRLIMLKARQWGGSTLVQTYMAWIQSVHRTNWNSLICSQVKDTSAGIRGMYTKILENYPEDLWEGDCPPCFKPYERSQNVRVIAGRGCRVTVSSIENQDAVRGADIAMAHLSEVAFWKATPQHSPEDVVRAVCGSVMLGPDSLIVMESTANGVGNFFHREWRRCASGRGDKEAVFIPWYEIEIYTLPTSDAERRAIAASLTDYERMLWEHGCTLDQINWYRHKRAECSSDEQMMSEFPSTAEEAFAATGSGVFAPRCVERLREDCREGERGDVVAVGRGDVGSYDGVGSGELRWCADARAPMQMWQAPVEGAEYVAAVDIGGRSAGADFSVVAVLRTDAERPEVVAQWRGHVDHDILASHAAEIGRFYNDALLVIESNSLESGAGAGYGMYILDRLSSTYPNLYRRRVYDDVRQCQTTRIGFHTNRSTKEMIIAGLISAVRSGGYIERDSYTCDELLTYEQRPDGSFAASDGNHDDCVMSRAIALHAAEHLPRTVDADSLRTPQPYW